MKKILIGIISILTVFIFFCAGCGSYMQNGSMSGDEDDMVVVHPKPGDDGQKEDKFTVELEKNSGKYIAPYTPGKTLKARWSSIDGSSIHEATFNEVGVAEIGGLDGEYKVTLVDLPDDVTYDPQGYSADNNNKHIVINILPIINAKHSTGSGLGTGTYGVVSANKTGYTYRAIIDSPWNGAFDQYSSKFEGIVFYSFTPGSTGVYSIESWVDITSNEVNPILEYYIGSYEYKAWDSRIIDGGAASTYTKNFRAEIQLTADEVGNVWFFGIHAESKRETYPIKIDFTVKYEGAVVEDTIRPNFTEVESNGPYGDPLERPSGVFKYNYKDTNYELRGSRFKLNKADGFYHLYDEDTYTDNNGFGPVLYVKITQQSEVMDVPFIKPQDDNNIVGVNLQFQFRDPFNYNVFVYKDYTNFIQKYAKYCNSDGVHPVNEELKQFLQDYAVKETLFRDGAGWAEIGNVRLRSSYEDQWLFGCGYYI